MSHSDSAARFYLQYHFPPSSVGEVGRTGAPGRRELGHGMLAQRALTPAIPDPDVFPYVVRMESHITDSNGSSSMASVCGGCLALLDAGVPMKRVVAGIAMGLVLEPNGSFVILTDILGLEDALGDMDFKVAGDADTLTAFQMDIKVQRSLSPCVCSSYIVMPVSLGPLCLFFLHSDARFRCAFVTVSLVLDGE